MKYTVSEKQKIYVEDRLVGELFYSQEFDDSVTPHDVGFQTVRERLDEQVREETERLTSQRPEARAEVSAEKEIRFTEEKSKAKPKPVSEVKSPFTGKPIPKPEREPAVTVESVEKAFPEDLAGLLYFEVTKEWFLAKPRQYLGSDNFQKIAAIAREQLGGEYVSAGKDSHFRIPRPKTAEPKAEPTPKQNLLDPDYLESLPWKSYKKKHPETGKKLPVGPGKPGWIFRNTDGAEALAELVEKQDPNVPTPVTMGGGKVFVCKFGGKEGQFIQRQPEKEES